MVQSPLVDCCDLCEILGVPMHPRAAGPGGPNTGCDISLDLALRLQFLVYIELMSYFDLE